MGFLNKPMMAASCRAMGGMRRMQLQAAGCMLLLPNKCCSCQTREQMPGQRMSAGVRRAWLPQLAALLVVIASPAQPQLPASPAVTPTTRLRPGAAGTPLQRSAIWINYADPQTAATSFRVRRAGGASSPRRVCSARARVCFVCACVCVCVCVCVYVCVRVCLPIRTSEAAAWSGDSR